MLVKGENSVYLYKKSTGIFLDDNEDFISFYLSLINKNVV